MKLLPDGKWQCPRCSRRFDVRPRLGTYCHPCERARTAEKRGPGWMITRPAHEPTVTPEMMKARAAARRRLEELADLRSVDFSNS